MDNVVVTGASRGLGAAIAERLAADGFHVVAVARKISEATAERITPVAFDLADTAAIPDFVRWLRQRFGPIYGLVNNAGLGTEGLLANMPDADIEALIRLNTLSPIVLSKYVVRGMMAQGRGRVVNISSIVASTGFNALSVYAATKASLVGFTRSLAREVGRVGVTVNAIAPGLHRHRDDAGFGRERPRAHRLPQRSATSGRARRRRGDGRLSHGRGRTQHLRRGADGGRRRDGVERARHRKRSGRCPAKPACGALADASLAMTSCLIAELRRSRLRRAAENPVAAFVCITFI